MRTGAALKGLERSGRDGRAAGPFAMTWRFEGCNPKVFPGERAVVSLRSVRPPPSCKVHRRCTWAVTHATEASDPVGRTGQASRDYERAQPFRAG